jgi:RNA polymerase sigma-70 factor (ECF subfamily)
MNCVEETIDKSLDEIIGGCIRNKEKSQEQMYKRFFGYAFKIALIHNRDRNIAMEIVNDSFMKVFSQIKRYDTTLPFTSWLGRIVVNTSIDNFRKNNRYITHDDSERLMVADTSPGIINELSADEILKMLNHLPEIHRMVFTLYELDGYSHEEISSMLNIPVSTSRVYLTRAKKRLRELFELFFNTSYEKTGN